MYPKQINKQMLERMRRKGSPSALLVGCRLVRPLWKTLWNFLRKLKMELPLDPAIPLLELYSKNPETPIKKKKQLCNPMFIAAQFTIGKCWKQPKCPSENKWIKKLWYIYKMEYYAAERKKELLSFATSMDGTGEHNAKWNKQAVKNKYRMISPISGT